MTLPKNLEVARQAKLQPLNEIASGMGLGEHLLEPFGESVAPAAEGIDIDENGDIVGLF